jgi:hypothetical protein
VHRPMLRRAPVPVARGSFFIYVCLYLNQLNDSYLDRDCSSEYRAHQPEHLHNMTDHASQD